MFNLLHLPGNSNFGKTSVGFVAQSGHLFKYTPFSSLSLLCSLLRNVGYVPLCSRELRLFSSHIYITRLLWLSTASSPKFATTQFFIFICSIFQVSGYDQLFFYFSNVSLKFFYKIFFLLFMMFIFVR